MELRDLRVNGKRLQATLEEMAKIGATPAGGVQRLTLTDEDKQARDLFLKWLKELNLEITIDEMGNIFGRRPGKNNNLPPVMSGSHIDSQPKGGRFDGTLGVMGLKYCGPLAKTLSRLIGPLSSLTGQMKRVLALPLQ